jgi:hypothetical protein
MLGTGNFSVQIIKMFMSCRLSNGGIHKRTSFRKGHEHEERRKSGFERRTRQAGTRAAKPAGDSANGSAAGHLRRKDSLRLPDPKLPVMTAER